MTPELQQAIEECRKRGIVRGAVVRTATLNDYEEILGDCSAWSVDRRGGIWSDNNLCLFDPGRNTWATVITPAPAPQEEEGLKEGDACECGPAMRAAIVELAEGFALNKSSASSGIVVYSEGGVYDCARGSIVGSRAKALYTPEEFIRRMRVTAKKPKPITIAGHKVLATKGAVEIDDTVYANSTIRAIAEKLID